MTKEQKEQVKKLLSNYKTMKAQIECIYYEIELLKDHIEFLKALRSSERYIIESSDEIEQKIAINKIMSTINASIIYINRLLKW